MLTALDCKINSFGTVTTRLLIYSDLVLWDYFIQYPSVSLKCQISKNLSLVHTVEQVYKCIYVWWQYDYNPWNLFLIHSYKTVPFRASFPLIYILGFKSGFSCSYVNKFLIHSCLDVIFLFVRLDPGGMMPLPEPVWHVM